MSANGQKIAKIDTILYGICEDKMDYQKYIRNFSIIAHIDHGKSTLADRLIEKTGLVADRDMKEQFLDNMELERERGITIKLQTTRLVYKAQDGQEYIYNLIDTPGHVDFTYEVSRSLAACEGAVLVVDATQGVEAQTLANVYLALDENLEILPVLNKMDLASARPDECKEEIEEIIGLDAADAPEISAKTGMGVEELLERIIDAVPAPCGDENGKLKALIFDSKYDNYLGVIIYARIMDGQVKKGDVIRMMATNKKYEVTEVGVCAPGLKPVKALRAGEVGYICASIKQVADARVGDTLPIPRCRAIKKYSPWYSAGFTRQRAKNTRVSRTPSKSCRSTMRRLRSSRRPPRRWATASAADSWVFCTWRSSSSVWNANSISA